MGYYTFIAKYLETNFRKTASTAGLTGGLSSSLSAAVGILISGLVIKKFKFLARCQFHQHFTSSFFIKKVFWSFIYSFAFYLFLAKEYRCKRCLGMLVKFYNRPLAAWCCVADILYILLFVVLALMNCAPMTLFGEKADDGIIRVNSLIPNIP